MSGGGAGAVHTVAVNMVLHDLVRAPLRGIISDLKGVTKAAIEANSGLKFLAQVGGFGLGSLALGGGALMGMEKLAKAGWDLVKVQKDMAQAGASALEVQEAYNESWKLTGKYGNMGAGEILNMFKDARQVFAREGHEFSEVIKEVDPFVRAGSFLKAYEGGKHKDGANLAGELFKSMASAEFAGKIDPKVAAEHVAQLVGMKVAFGHGMSIGKFFQTQGAAGQSLRNADDDFLYGMLPAISQIMPGTGPALMTAFQRIGAGTMWRNKSARYAHDIGMIEDGGIDAKGALIDPSKIKNWKQFHTNPAKWVHETLKPLLDKIAPAGSAEQVQALSRLFPDRNAAKIIGEFLNPQMYSKLVKDAENVKLAAQRFKDHWKEYLDNNLDYQHQRFNAQMKNIAGALGMGSVDSWVGLVRKVNDGLTGIAQFMQAHPGVGSHLSTALAGLAAFFGGVGLVGFGLLAYMLVSVTGSVGLFVGGLAALVAVLAKYDMLNWAGLKKGLSDLWDWMFAKGQGERGENGGITARKEKGWVRQAWDNSVDSLAERGSIIMENLRNLGPSIMNDLKGLGSMIADGVRGIPDRVLDAANSAWHSIGSGMASAISGIPGMVMDAIAEMASAIGSAISAMASAIGSAISNAISGIAGRIGGFFGFGGGGAKGGSGGGGAMPNTDAAGSVIPQSFTPSPPKGGGGQMIQANLHIDGERFASVTGRALAAHYEIPTQAAQHDAGAGWTAPDGGTMEA